MSAPHDSFATEADVAADTAAGTEADVAASLPPTGIVLAATPLGNIADASPRLAHALGSADVVAAEDTRRTRALAAALGVEITGRVVSNFDHNEESRARELLDAARAGTVLVVTDAGMPSVSDPGYRVVRACVEADLPLTYTDTLRYIGSSIDVVIQTGRAGGDRGVLEFYIPDNGDEGEAPHV